MKRAMLATLFFATVGFSCGEEGADPGYCGDGRYWRVSHGPQAGWRAFPL